jgi:aspartokinase-like uncharacterized kinase
MTVVKVGGSLFDHSVLIPGLTAWRAGIDGPVLVIPGGGAMADVVRQWDRVHRLGDALSHRLAIRTMAAAGELLKAVPGFEVFDCESVLSDDGMLPSWAVTSDSIAARVAGMSRANRLVLLKSVDIPAGVSWSTAAANGWVDEYFPTIVSRLTCPIEVVNFRRWLDDNGFGKWNG